MANIIGDIAGNYNTLMALLDKMPDDEPISIGDMIDRGPRSKEVVEFFMSNGRAILGNHEHLMLDHYDETYFYQHGMWFYNGGGATFDSFGGYVPDEVRAWMHSLPKYIEIDDILVSHSFIHPDLTLEEALVLGENSSDPQCDKCIIWSRDIPIRRPDYALQLAGHNSQFGLRRFDDEQGTYAICLDDCRNKVLTGINTDTLQVYQQEYID